MNKITFIIVTWNSEKTITPCLESISKLKNLITEVIVIDNASVDKTVAEIKKFKQVKIVENKNNTGFAAGCNRGIKEAKGDLICLLNPDAEIKDNFQSMVEYLQENKEVGIVGPKILNTDGSLQREITPFPNFLSQVLMLLKLHRLGPLSKLVYPNYDYDKLQEAEHLMGSALLIRREVFEKIGFLDKKFFLWFEETDFEKRAKEAGFKIVYYPNASVSHIRAATIGKLSPLKRQSIWNESVRYYFKKHKSKLKQYLLEPFILTSYIPAFLKFVGGKIKR
jgi:GT2 family glycosyltransferase